MIALLTGRLRRKAVDYLIIDVSGVGYQVQTPLSTYYKLPEIGEEVTLHIHTYVREDALSLYGFLGEQEKGLFLLLMGVSGIGPRLALGMLSSLSVADIAAAIQTADDSKLCTIPGIGKKTAARLVLELKDKTKLLPIVAMPSDRRATRTDHRDDALWALVNLGYKKQQAEEALKKIVNVQSGLTIEALIREALSVLMRH
jgi:holliday junction DNA helicase RuvA